tara:strand:- start:1643 stop:2068 length:426 start_codon:yes stop_codon:yes gene_type:complete
VKRYVVYNTSSGAVIRMATGPDDMPVPTPPAGHAVTATTDFDTPLKSLWYNTVTEELEARPVMSLVFDPVGKEADADGIDEIVVTGIPNPTWVVAALPDGYVVETVEDGQIEISCTVAGKGYIHFINNTHQWVMAEEVEFV